MKTYSARELTEILQREGYDSINVRNIHYYRQIGLLTDLVEVNGKNRFTDKHLDYLRAMRTLQKTGDNLSDIKSKLENLDESQVRNVGSQMAYYTSERVIQSVTHYFNEDISITFSQRVAEDTKNDIIRCVEKELKNKF